MPGEFFHQELAPDEPADTLTPHGVSVAVGGASLRDHPRELGVGDRGTGAGNTSDQEREKDSGTGLVLRTAPAGENTPAPMLAPKPNAVSGHNPTTRWSPPPSSRSACSISSTGLRRKVPVGALLNRLAAASSKKWPRQRVGMHDLKYWHIDTDRPAEQPPSRA